MPRGLEHRVLAGHGASENEASDWMQFKFINVVRQGYSAR